MKILESFVCGSWRKGEGSGAVLVNPATEQGVAETSTAGVDMQATLAYARDVGGPALRKMSFGARGAMLKRMSSALHEAREHLIDTSLESTGATRGDAKFDIDGAIGTLAYYAKLGETLADKKFLVEGPAEPLLRSARFAGYHVWSPRTGVAVHINAFNFPAWGLAEKAACALLAGVPVITKPATSTAWVAYEVARVLLEKAGLPEGALQILCGSVGDLLEGLMPEDVLAFTGSADTGAKLRRSRAVIERSVRLNIEADSLNAAVLGDDVEEGSETWHLFLRHVAIELTQKTGQKCTATRRIFVPRARIDAVQAALVERLSTVKVGDPKHEGVEMGPLATASQLKDAHAGLGKLEAAGARAVLDGRTGTAPIGVPAGKGFFMGPTLLRHDDPKNAGPVHAHEIFGPSSTLMPYDDREEVCALVARGEGTLVQSVYSDDKDFLATIFAGCASWTGRILVGSAKVADTAVTPGMVLPSCVHGGPGRAGGGEELGGERGVKFYMQRTAIQGDRSMLDRLLGAPRADDAAKA